MSWRLRPLKLAVLAAALCAASPALADGFVINLDEARVLKLPDRVATIIIGNPLIADASLQANGMLVVTGKGYGATNLLALDRQGRVVMDKSLQVTGPGQGNVITVYKGITGSPTVARRNARRASRSATRRNSSAAAWRRSGPATARPAAAAAVRLRPEPPNRGQPSSWLANGNRQQRV
jgi:Flp pilus assembly secretin CpaC